MSVHQKTRTNRRGLTLVEMMISVVLTLMVVFAVVRIFESLGDSVTDGRATIEMSGNLRTAAQLLQKDLQGLTVTTLPPRDPAQGEGYLELLDGPGTDSQYVVPMTAQSTASGPGILRLNQSAMLDSPDEPDGYLEPVNSGASYDTSVGDVDDILAFTSHRTEEPFTGMISDPRILRTDLGTPKPIIESPLAPTLILDSQDAEIVWWLQVERVPANASLSDLAASNVNDQINLASVGDAVLYPNGTTPVRTLHRRVLLIRPDLDLRGVILNSKAEIDTFLSNNDLSVRVVREGTTSKYRVFPNTLADLTERHNRSFRSSWKGINPMTRTAIPQSRLLPVRTNGVMLARDSELIRQAAMKDMVVKHPAYTIDTTEFGTTSSVSTLPRDNIILLRKGKDVVLSDVLAFDLQVWDPEAIVRSTSDGDIVLPHDPGYLLKNNINVNTVDKEPEDDGILTSAGQSGYGAYVDLGFATRPKLPSQLDPQFWGNFGGPPNAKSQLVLNDALTDGYEAAVYCSWTSTYEHDGLNQYDQNSGVKLIDEGYDGIDNDNAFGIDDRGELETSPPYPHPLRGLKVTLRTIDFGTRQVRQTSITTDFLPE